MKVDSFPTDVTAFPAVFRWRIPHLPSHDSVEFTFYAVDPPSEDYEVALYKSDRVIVEKVKGEPAPTKRSDNLMLLLLLLLFGSVALLVVVGPRLGIVAGPPVDADTFTVVKEAGCDLRVVTSYDRYEPDSDIRIIQHRIFNAGQGCVVQSDQLDPKGPFTIGAGDTVTRQRLAGSRPKLVQTEVFVGVSFRLDNFALGNVGLG